MTASESRLPPTLVGSCKGWYIATLLARAEPEHLARSMSSAASADVGQGSVTSSHRARRQTSEAWDLWCEADPCHEVANGRRTSEYTWAENWRTSSPCWEHETIWSNTPRSFLGTPTHYVLPCGVQEISSNRDHHQAKEPPSVCVREVSAHHRSRDRRPFSATADFTRVRPTLHY